MKRKQDKDELKAIEDRYRNVRREPWHLALKEGTYCVVTSRGTYCGIAFADGDFMIHAHVDIPNLLDHVEVVNEELEATKDDLHELQGRYAELQSKCDGKQELIDTYFKPELDWWQHASLFELIRNKLEQWSRR